MIDSSLDGLVERSAADAEKAAARHGENFLLQRMVVVVDRSLAES
jgi:hypothetical protein